MKLKGDTGVMRRDGIKISDAIDVTEARIRSTRSVFDIGPPNNRRLAHHLSLALYTPCRLFVPTHQIRSPPSFLFAYRISFANVLFKQSLL